MDKKVFRWDPYFRCINPNELKLQLPTGECRITIWTARNFTKWYWGYSSSLFFDDIRRPRLTDTDYDSEREAKYAALEMLIDCTDMVMYKVDNDCWCKTDSCGDVEIGYEAVKPDGAFYLFVKAPEADANAFCERAKKYELLLVPSDSFGRGGYVRVSYCVRTEQIKRAIPAFRALWESYEA